MSPSNLLKYGLLAVVIVIAGAFLFFPEFANASSIAQINAPLTESKSSLKTIILPLSYLAALVFCLWLFSRPGGPGLAIVSAFAATVLFVVGMTVT